MTFTGEVSNKGTEEVIRCLMELEGYMKPILLLSGYDYAAKKQDRIIQVFQASGKLYAFMTWKPRFAIWIRLHKGCINPHSATPWQSSPDFKPTPATF